MTITTIPSTVFADDSHDKAEAKRQSLNLSLEDYQQRLVEKTCPLAHKTYDEQLQVGTFLSCVKLSSL